MHVVIIRVGPGCGCARRAFVSRKNAFLVGEADKLLAQMVADSAKGLQPMLRFIPIDGQQIFFSRQKKLLTSKMFGSTIF